MRLFVAIDFPDSVKDQLARLRSEIPTARWVGRDQLHLTLRFIGDGIEPARLEKIKAALAAVQGSAFDLRLHGTGRFPEVSQSGKAARRLGPPRVLWVGVEVPPALAQLQRDIEAAVVALGFPPETKPFSPHITLARLQTDRPLPQVDAFLAVHARFRTETMPVDSFYLVSSVLSPAGPHYQHEAKVTLLKS